MNYILLQNKIKKDPVSYRAEFLQQRKHFQAELEIFLLKPGREYKNFAALVLFLSQVASCYPQDLQQFPTQIANLLEQHGPNLDHELRKSLVNALILLRKRDIISPSNVFTLFFKLSEIKDKVLYQILYRHIVSDIQRINSKRINQNLNRAFQNFLQTIITDHVKSMSLMALRVLVELFKKGVWRDSKTVSIVSMAVFNPNPKVLNHALDFFVKPLVDDEDVSNYSEQDRSYSSTKSKILRKLGPNAVCKVNRRKKKFKQAMGELKNVRQNQLEDRMDDRKNYNSEAILLINDPQGYAEKAYRMLVKSTNSFETKIKIMNFLSRLINAHRLLLLDYYSYMVNYLKPSKQRVTVLLAIVIQACHPLVPPDVVEPLVKTIVNNFISDTRPHEVVVVGLNTIREICMRSPHALNEVLLSDLLQYIKNKNSGVSIAAKSILSLYRVLNPSLLPKKLKASKSSREDQDVNNAHPLLEYGQVRLQTEIDGIELLEQFKSGNFGHVELSSSSDSEESEDLNFVENFEEEEDCELESCSSSEEGEECSSQSSLASWMLSDDEGLQDEHETSDEPKIAGANHILTDEEWDLIRKLKKAKERGKLDSFISSKQSNVYQEIAAKLEQIQSNDVMDTFDVPLSSNGLDKESAVNCAKRAKKELLRQNTESRNKRLTAQRTNSRLKKRKPFKMLKYSKQVRQKEKLPLFVKSQRKLATATNMQKMPKSLKSKILNKK